MTKAMALQHRGLGTSVSSINAGPLPGDTEFIQISQPIRNPQQAGGVTIPGSQPMNSAASTPLPRLSPAPQSNTPDNLSPRSLTPVPHGQDLEDMEREDGHPVSPVPGN